jgi:hypothetical protein
LHTDASGVHGVWVNGVRVAGINGMLAEAGLPGVLIRDFAT